VLSLLKNSFEEVIRERKVSFPSGTDARSGLKGCNERATNRLRKATKNKKRGNLEKRRRAIGVQELKRKPEAC
jgi:hypothetical protein